MYYDGKKELMCLGLNKSVIKSVLRVYDQSKNQTAELIADLKNFDTDTQCQSIFDYLVNNVKYKEDEGIYQWIKTPGRLLHDRVGDCKSFSIFLGSCLHCLKVPFCFRFVSFGGNAYTHVYIVANPDTQNEIILDAVERNKENLPVYNYARNFVKKIDINR